ncbi:response regulator [Corynebacterium lactis]|uniref:LuxR family transcriptional regulator n=1 Tax=Corynebacterium lactis RW2-5 TaxID=1408189 RepID=A0A0K2GXV3_9CORY|nr:response regulator transcription factor [Corynebacterium lactis]ALA66508.1 LuxR family transcriptional regulator [Corynebacterium lactis RW2-5]
MNVESVGTVRVVLADDEELMRNGIRMLIEADPGIDVVGEASNGKEALAVVEELRPDVVLMDIRMPVLGGIDATRRLCAKEDGPAVVMLTAFDTDEFIVDALEAGAAGFLLKNSSLEELVETIKGAATGRPLVSFAVLQRLTTIAKRGQHAAGTAAQELLSVREREVAELIARGMTNVEIAEHLLISLPTVKSHVARIMTKLEATNRVQIALRFVED